MNVVSFSKLIPAFLPDEEEREEGYSTESLSDTDIRYLSGQVEEVVDEEPLSWEAPSSKKSKKRKRGKEEELSPQITVTATFAQPTVLDAAAELEDEELVRLFSRLNNAFCINIFRF